MNWQSKKHVLLLLGVVGLLMAGAGMAAAWHNRHHTICADRRAPKGQQPGILGQTLYLCHDGRVVTTAS
jgi:hypothetical protein